MFTQQTINSNSGLLVKNDVKERDGEESII